VPYRAIDALTEDPLPPHRIECAGQGWAWHRDPERVRCYVGTVSAPLLVVAAAIDDDPRVPGVDRLLAIAKLRDYGTTVFRRIFAFSCRACGRNHYEAAAQALRAVKQIHPGAIVMLREKRVPVHLLARYRVLDGPEKPTPQREPPKRKKAPGLPVWSLNAERCRTAQIAFACQYGSSQQGISHVPRAFSLPRSEASAPAEAQAAPGEMAGTV